ncbi:methyltransferase domain-containing protein [Paenibacillus barcinonensis]|uniref:methyltransferase domain-containing protein n=1 Tax=Paenibacillus barcinonensis TaxID=198119 RepID=UPI001C12609F|nr:methyltransferase domain-containing protein [Paenibacillus barcinonensis]MBU5353500.1 methyltransferase domain-containing protein [Paenibacillus barcinonensis]
MHLIIKASGEGAGQVSHLLAKNPNNLYDRTDKGVRVRMVYTKAEEQETEVLIHAEPDSVDLVRGTPDGYDITQYINDREFVTSSLFCSYMRSALGTALNGKPKEDYTQWVDHVFELELTFGPVASDLPDRVVEELFSALGYDVAMERGESAYSFDLKNRSTVRHITLRGKQTIQQALRQLFLLIPVLDNYKHYFISEDEIDKIKRYGEGWLDTHPLKELIVRRTLHFAELIRTYERKHGTLTFEDAGTAQAGVADGNREKRLNSESETLGHDGAGEDRAAETKAETDMDTTDTDTAELSSDTAPVRLNELRYRAITDIVASLPNKRRIVDMGAGEGKLSARLAYIPGVEMIAAVEPSGQSRLRAKERFARLQDRAGVKAVPEAMLGSLFYFDEQMQHMDVMILCEVIEHVEEYRLDRIMDTILNEYRPEVLLVTTPNKEYNEVYEMEQKQLRHQDHRFEWTREQFSMRCAQWAEKGDYAYGISGIGEHKEGFGQPTQLVKFSRRKEEQA